MSLYRIIVELRSRVENPSSEDASEQEATKLGIWNILITGSGGLIGSEAVEYFDRQGHRVIGVDNNMRREFFGPEGNTLWNLARLKNSAPRFEHHDLDIRNRPDVFALFERNRFDAILRCAAQPTQTRRRKFRSSTSKSTLWAQPTSGSDAQILSGGSLRFSQHQQSVR